MYMYIKVTQRLPELLYTFTHFLLKSTQAARPEGRKRVLPHTP